MKIAIVSDIHHHHWKSAMQRDSSVEHPITVIDRSIRIERPDLIIDAGDYENGGSYYGMLEHLTPVVKVQGNHDYYGTTWDNKNIETSMYDIKFGKIKIVCATLWTNLLTSYGDMLIPIEAVKRGMADFYAIRGFTVEHWLSAHKEHVKFIKENGADADIIVTHHSPTWRSVHPVYEPDALTYGFSSHLDDLITSLSPKYWIHGHTHMPFDYMHGNTRIICNPCGYPHERMQRRAYEPVYIEI